MNAVEVILNGPMEALEYGAELWCANQLMAVTVVCEGRLTLRIDPRLDGAPWLADVTSLERALAEASQRLAAF